MAGQYKMRGARSAIRQRGWAMLLTAALVALGVLGVVFSMSSSTSTLIANQRAQMHAQVLAVAKEALIGYAVSQTNQPGALPCPDTDNDGTADSPCGGAGVTAIGRLPWRTLGLPDLRDAAGECLWYAVSSNFKNSGVSGPAVINSDSWGTLVVNDGAGTPLPSPPNPAAAIVFAPGAALAGQDRTPPVGPATTCGGNANAVNYLEGSNAVAGTTFVSSPASATLNDRLQLVSTADIMTPVERRAAREILARLESYRTSGGNWCGCYPWSDRWDGASNEGDLWGRVPLIDASTGSTPSWAAAGVTVPAWLTNNQWWWVFLYAVAPNQSAWGGAGSLTVNGVGGVGVVLITTGPAGAGRPAGVPFTSWNNADWALYVDDSYNSDVNDTVFQTPFSTTYARDRIYTLP
jgi:hypothetical protein